MPTIIYPPSIPWNWMFQRPQQLLRELSMRGYNILYEDPGRFSKPHLHKLSSRFALCQGFSALEIPHSRPRILWLTVPSHINLASQYAPDLIIYDAVDEPSNEFAGWAPYYPAIIARADLIFATARSIFERLSASHPHVYLVPNGVDFEHFAARQHSRPSDLPNGRPIIGYSGAIAPWLDWDLLDYVFRYNPDLLFVFIGTLYEMDFPLKQRNSVYLGLKPYSTLPAYLQHFHVGLIPFRITEMTKGCNPIKLYEYYAAGLPVLGTPLPELLSVPKIHLENNPQRFSLRLRHLLNLSAERTERIVFAQANSWSIRASRIDQRITQMLHLKGLSSL